MSRAVILWAGVGLLVALWAMPLHAQTVTALAQLNDNQLRGSWFQIARFPDKREKKCTGDVYELIARAEKAHSLLLVDSCKANTKGGYADVHNYTARPADKKSPDGRLKIYTLFPFSRKYWMLALAPDQSWFVAGSPDHKSLWIYSKSSMMDTVALGQAEALATAQGFATNRLVMTPQTGSGTIVTPVVMH